MARIGLLTATSAADDTPGLARAGLVVAGQTLFARQVRLLRAHGITTVLVYTGDDALAAPTWFDTTPEPGLTLVTVRTGPELVGRIRPEDTVVLLEEGVLLSPDIVAAVLAEAPEADSTQKHALAIWPAESEQGALGVRLDAHSSFGSVVVTTGDTARGVARGLGDWDLTQTLVRTALGSGLARRVDLAEAAVQGPSRPLWLPVRTAAQGAAATARLVRRADDEPLPAPERLLGAPLERALAGALVARPIPAAALHIAGIVLVLAGLLLVGGGLPTAGLLALLLGGIAERAGVLMQRVRLDRGRLVAWGGRTSRLAVPLLPLLLAGAIATVTSDPWPLFAGASASLFVVAAGLLQPAGTIGAGMGPRLARLRQRCAGWGYGRLTAPALALLVGLGANWAWALAALWGYALVAALWAVRDLRAASGAR